MSFTLKRFARGFGLLEIMIYIAILALLAATAGPALMRYFSSSQKSATKTALKNTVDAVNLYYTHTGRYPESLGDLTEKPSDPSLAQRWDGPYLANVKAGEAPLDGWSHELQYQKLDKGYELYSFGPNGEEGDESERMKAENE